MNSDDLKKLTLWKYRLQAKKAQTHWQIAPKDSFSVSHLSLELSQACAVRG
jgi:hypothetical protein